MSQAQLIVKTMASVIIIAGWLAISLLEICQRRSQAQDSKITDEIERDNPFSL
jgi:uncharacterized membrane protein